jgi:hypothetical protein
MEPFSAAAVYETARCFEQLRATYNLIERFGKVKFSGSEISPHQMESIELLTGGPDVSGDDDLGVPHVSRFHVGLRLALCDPTAGKSKSARSPRRACGTRRVTGR